MGYLKSVELETIPSFLWKRRHHRPVNYSVLITFQAADRRAGVECTCGRGMSATAGDSGETYAQLVARAWFQGCGFEYERSEAPYQYIT